MRARSNCLLLAVICLGCNPAEEAQKNTATDVSEIVEGGNQFALELYQQLRSQEGNLFFSPSSISTATPSPPGCFTM